MSHIDAFLKPLHRFAVARIKRSVSIVLCAATLPRDAKVEREEVIEALKVSGFAIPADSTVTAIVCELSTHPEARAVIIGGRVIVV